MKMTKITYSNYATLEGEDATEEQLSKLLKTYGEQEFGYAPNHWNMKKLKKRMNELGVMV